MTVKKFGLMMTNEAVYDEEGFTEILVIVQESGLMIGAPPLEYRIHCTVPQNDEDFGRQYVALLNRRTDLPFYLARARIKIDPASLEKVRDEDLSKRHLDLLPDKIEVYGGDT